MLRRFVRHRRGVGLLGAALAAALAWVGATVVEAGMQREAVGKTVSVDAAPARDVAIVLGAGAPLGVPSPVLRARLVAAVALVHSGKVQRVLVTGMPEEAAAMQAFCVAARVAPAQIVVDDGASRTLENLRRARDLFAIRSALIVTNPFHLARALYLADALGIDAVGVAADGPAPQLGTRLRERIAALRAWLDVRLLPAPPR